MNDFFARLLADPRIVWLLDHPWSLLAILAAPFLLLAAWKRIYPSKRLVLVASFPVALAACTILFPFLRALRVLDEDSQIITSWQTIAPTIWIAIIIADAVLLLIAAADFVTMPRARGFSAERKVMRIASLRQNHSVTLTISNLSRKLRPVWVRDDYPEHVTVNPKQFVLRLRPRSRATVHYELQASRRGAFDMNCVHIRVRSLLGLWQSVVQVPVRSIVHVYPDMKQLAEYAVLARTNRLSLMGVRRTRKIGQDNEFERLRDYTRDDNFKHIDWRTTARRNKLTVKDFQTNHSQRIIFLLDCGRMMTNEAVGLSLLDHALNAILMMSYVALRQGDSVGLISFSDQVHNFVPPRGGMKQMNQLLHASFDRFPQLVESRYDQAFLYLRTHCLKRSLVVLISNIIDEVNSHQLQQYLSSMVGRHLPLGVLLRDHQLFDAADTLARSDADFYRSAAAAEILSWRHQVLTDLEHQGVLTVDSFPEDMTAPLVNRYLEIKARHLL